MDWPLSLLDKPTLHTYSPEAALGEASHLANANLGSGSWPSANQAIYIPILIPLPFVIKQFFVLNGGTVSGNLDLGIYDYGLSKKISTGSTAQSGTSTRQLVNVTDTAFPPGRYYLAIAVDNTTAQFLQVNIQAPNPHRMFGVAQQASAFPLPSTATLAALAGTGIGVLFGAQIERMP